MSNELLKEELLKEELLKELWDKGIAYLLREYT